MFIQKNIVKMLSLSLTSPIKNRSLLLATVLGKLIWQAAFQHTINYQLSSSRLCVSIGRLAPFVLACQTLNTQTQNKSERIANRI